MVGEILIIITGFISWILKGCKTDLSEEINGKKNSDNNTRAKNYLIGILIFILFILILILT
jgi:uncharacterized membrane protein YkgB